MPKAQTMFIREETKGFEFSLISISASIGSMYLGSMVEKYGVSFSVAIFAVTYILIAIILFFGLKIDEKATLD